tara:strand:- start:234 stop:455 length:222 start_codon:yes stop_codon:yes gene_type:complete
MILDDETNGLKPLKTSFLVRGKYNFPNEKENLVYLGKEGLWNHFADVKYPELVYCKLLDEHLDTLEETATAEG